MSRSLVALAIQIKISEARNITRQEISMQSNRKEMIIFKGFETNTLIAKILESNSKNWSGQIQGYAERYLR
jgi:hypothetical protein